MHRILRWAFLRLLILGDNNINLLGVEKMRKIKVKKKVYGYILPA